MWQLTQVSTISICIFTYRHSFKLKKDGFWALILGIIPLIFSVAYGLPVVYSAARISRERSISLKLQKFWAECCGKWCRPLLRKRLREKRLTAGQNGSVLQERGTTRRRVLDVDVFQLLQTKALPVDLFKTSHFTSP